LPVASAIHFTPALRSKHTLKQGPKRKQKKGRKKKKIEEEIKVNFKKISSQVDLLISN